MKTADHRANQLFTYCVFGALSVCAFAFCTQGFMLTGMIDFYKLESASQGAVSASSSIGSIIALTFATLLEGRVKKPLILLFCLAGLAVCFVTAGLLPPFAFMLLCYAIYGLFFGLLDTTCSSLIADLHPGEQGKKYMGLLHGMFGVGSLLAPLFFEWLLFLGLQWNQLLIVVGVLFLLACAAYSLGYARCKRVLQQDSLPAAKLTLAHVTTFLKNRRNLLLLLLLFCYSFHQMGLSLWTKRYISDFLNAGQLGAITLCFLWAGTALSRIVMPRFSVSPKKLVLYGNLVAGGCVLVGALSQNAWGMCVAIAVAGLAQGHSLPMLLNIGCNWYPKQTMLATTMMLWVFYMAQMVSPIVIAFVADVFGSLLFGMLLTGSMALVTAIVMIALMRVD